MGAGLPPASAPTAGPGPCRAPQDPARSRVVAPQAGPSAPHAPPTGAGETHFLGHKGDVPPCRVLTGGGDVELCGVSLISRPSPSRGLPSPPRGPTASAPQAHVASTCGVGRVHAQPAARSAA